MHCFCGLSTGLLEILPFYCFAVYHQGDRLGFEIYLFFLIIGFIVLTLRALMPIEWPFGSQWDRKDYTNQSIGWY